MTTTLLQPGEIEAAAGDIPELRLPPADVFLSRARRLEQLAEGHTLGDYLRFVARLARAQQEYLAAGPAAELPAPERLAQCREHQMPPLAPAGLGLPDGWRDTARHLARTVLPSLPATGQARRWNRFWKNRMPGWTRRLCNCLMGTSRGSMPPWRRL